MSDLEEHRRNIDVIDAQIIELIAQRKHEVEGVILVKARTGTAALQPRRWSEVVAKCRKLAAEKELDPDVIEEIWDLLHDYALELERQRLGTNGDSGNG